MSAHQTQKAERHGVPGEGVPAWATLALALLGTFGAVLAAALVVDPVLATRLMSWQGNTIERHESRWTPAMSEVAELRADTAESPERQPSSPAMASISPGTDAGSAIPSASGPTDEILPDRPHSSAVRAGDCPPLFLVTFAWGGTKPIAQELQEKAAKLGAWLGAHPQVRLHLDGHADRSGPDEVNMLLSFRRAKAVAVLLTAAGVPSGQLSLGAYGDSLPAEGLPPESAQNRRVSMRVDGVPECTDAMKEGKIL